MYVTNHDDLNKTANDIIHSRVWSIKKIVIQLYQITILLISIDQKLHDLTVEVNK